MVPGLHGIAGNVREWTSSGLEEGRMYARHVSEAVTHLGWGLSFGTDWTSPAVDEPAMLAVRHVRIAQTKLRHITTGLRCARRE